MTSDQFTASVEVGDWIYLKDRDGHVLRQVSDSEKNWNGPPEMVNILTISPAIAAALKL